VSVVHHQHQPTDRRYDVLGDPAVNDEVADLLFRQVKSCTTIRDVVR